MGVAGVLCHQSDTHHIYRASLYLSQNQRGVVCDPNASVLVSACEGCRTGDVVHPADLRISPLIGRPQVGHIANMLHHIHTRAKIKERKQCLSSLPMNDK